MTWLKMAGYVVGAAIVVTLLYLAYDSIYAEPRRQLADMMTSRDDYRTKFDALTLSAAQSQAAGQECSNATSASAAVGAAQTEAATHAAEAARAAAEKRRRKLPAKITAADLNKRLEATYGSP